MLFNVLMGLRRQEINGLKYSDVDYINRTLSVERQLGKELDRNPDTTVLEPMTKRELPLKSSSSKRVLPIPDYVFEAILEESVMKGTETEENPDSLIPIIFAVLRMGSLAVKTSIGGTIRNF